LNTAELCSVKQKGDKNAGLLFVRLETLEFDLPPDNGGTYRDRHPSRRTYIALALGDIDKYEKQNDRNDKIA
jgi:hypothetical protein